MVSRMVVSPDPEGMEIALTKKYVSFDNKDVLEVGCGEGRLTFQYAPVAKSVTALDPNRKSISSAKKKSPEKLSDKLSFRVGKGEELAFADNSFDIVFFTWSLCCTDIPAMGRAVAESWRVLRPGGILASIQPSLHQPFQYGMVGYLIDKHYGPAQQEDEAYVQSRLALRHASLVERKFGLVAEAEFPSYTYYDTEREALKGFISGRRERYAALDQRTKRLIREVVRERGVKTKKGIRMQENAVLTVLRRVERTVPP
jgi:ubiquinone/menaquinone biosynthesis C-methylase UbiE